MSFRKSITFILTVCCLMTSPPLSPLAHSKSQESEVVAVEKLLKANEDLTATICLAHDIGHSPFGHHGERKLNELMAEHGGFDHNEQSLRWIDELEIAYPTFTAILGIAARRLMHDVGLTTVTTQWRSLQHELGTAEWERSEL